MVNIYGMFWFRLLLLLLSFGLLLLYNVHIVHALYKVRRNWLQTFRNIIDRQSIDFSETIRQ